MDNHMTGHMTGGTIFKKMPVRLLGGLIAAGLALMLGTGMAVANPVDGGLGLQEAASPFMEQVHQFHNWVLMPIIVGISLLVLALLLIIIFKFNSKANPTPAKFSHNTLIEVIWTGVPILILLFVAVFSFPLLFSADVIPDGKRYLAQDTELAETFTSKSDTEFVIANDFSEHRRLSSKDHVEVFVIRNGERRELTYRKEFKLSGLKTDEVTIALTEPLAAGEELEIIAGRSRVGAKKFLDLFGTDNSQIVVAPSINIKVTGFQWGWNYAYPDEGDFEFNALIKKKEDLDDTSLYLFEPTKRIVVPVNETVRILTTGREVIHSWALPVFGVKIDAVPGRINESWFMATREGVFYGQCSEICGKDHAFMPIAVEVVSREEYQAWVDSEREFAGLEPKYTNTIKLAANADQAQ